MGLFHRKTVGLYMLTNKYQVDADDTPIDLVIYTITKNKRGCLEYLDRFLFNVFKEDFYDWCEKTGISSEGMKPWNLYKKERLKDFIYENFDLSKNYYDLDTIALILRMFSNCPPMGCFYEKPIECEHYLDSLDEETKLRLQENDNSIV